MKKLLFVFAIAAVGSLASCKKDYTCACTYTDPIEGEEATQDFPYEKQKKGDAEDLCDKQQTQFQMIDSDAKCSLD